MKYLDKDGLLYVWQKIKAAFVSKEAGKGLSSNDFTTEYKNKVDANAEAKHTHENKAIIDNITSGKVSEWDGKSDFSGSYNDLTNKPTIPTDNKNLTNGAGYQTSEQVQQAINTALSGITGISFKVVTTLPAAGEGGTIYLKSNGGTGQNI